MRRLCAPHFQFFWKKNEFSALFWPKIAALKTLIFQIFVPKTPHFSRKNRSLDPTFGNPCGTHPPQKSWVPPGIGDSRDPCIKFKCWKQDMLIIWYILALFLLHTFQKYNNDIRNLGRYLFSIRRFVWYLFKFIDLNASYSFPREH